MVGNGDLGPGSPGETPGAAPAVTPEPGDSVAARTTDPGAVAPPGPDAEAMASPVASRPSAQAAAVPSGSAAQASQSAGGDSAVPGAAEPALRPVARTPVPPEPDWKEQYDKSRSHLLRVAADFENYKKRTKRDLQDAAHRARDEILQELLPVIDNLERALGHATTAGNEGAGSLVEGVQMVLRTFQASMARFGLKGLDVVGQPFDPTFHEALSQRETTQVPPGNVLEEYRRGYVMGDRLIRAALVVVARAPAQAAAPSEPAARAEMMPEGTPATPEEKAPDVKADEGGASPEPLRIDEPGGGSPEESC